MFTGLVREARTVVISVIASSLVVGVPATAAIIATNSDRLDGKHAVGYAATPAQRKGRLVATSPITGRLPNSIIAKAPDADQLDGVHASGFLRSTGKAVDADKLDGLDTSAFLRSTGKAGDADKLDGLDSRDLLVTGGGARGDGATLVGCSPAAELASYPLTLDRPGRVMATAWTALGLGVPATLHPGIQINLLDSRGQAVAFSNRSVHYVGTPAWTGGSDGGSLYIGEVLMSGSAPYDAAPGTYTLAVFGSNSGACDSTSVRYFATTLTHVLLASGD